MTGVAQKFHWADYLVFGLSFGIAILIGIIVAVKSKLSKQNSESYLIANRKLNWFMVSLSVLSTAMSAKSMVTLPTEYYFTGNKLIWVFGTYVVACLFTTIIAIPKYHRLGLVITSSFEYFEARYNVGVRMLFALYLFMLSIISSGVALYVPSIVLTHVSALNIYWSMVIGAFVCAVYSALGGMKAVVWVDNFQTIAMFTGLIILVALGMQKAGGWVAAWDIFEKYHRNNAIDLDPSPWKRHNVWNLVFLLGIHVGAFTSFDQSLLQRYMTVPSMRHAQFTIILTYTGISIIQMMIFFIAVSAFALYGGNDPLLLGELGSKDEIFPFYMMDIVGNYPGVPGVIVSCLFAAALSSLSSGITARASTFLEDFVRPIYKFRTKTDLSQRAASIISKVAGTGVGVLTIVASVMVPALPDTLFIITLALSSLSSGPMLGVFLTSFFIPFVEPIGIVCGFIASVVWAANSFFGMVYFSTGIGNDYLPLYKNNFTEVVTRAPIDAQPTFFDISYTWYAVLAGIVAAVVASAVSAVVILVRAKGKWHYKKPRIELLYTLEDFLVAIGVKSQNRKNQTGKEFDGDKDSSKQENAICSENGLKESPTDIKAPPITAENSFHGHDNPGYVTSGDEYDRNITDASTEMEAVENNTRL